MFTHSVDAISVKLGEIDATFIQRCRNAGIIAWDIETSGLNWQDNEIATCQIYIPGEEVCIVPVKDDAASIQYLSEVLSDQKIQKIFHHAMFDLRFMAHHWRVSPSNVCCTKIASKINSPQLSVHSLKNLLQTHLNVVISKDMQISDWLSPTLTEDQIRYAARDVLHLPDLLNILMEEITLKGLGGVVETSFDFIPTRVLLEINGYGDIFQY